MEPSRDLLALLVRRQAHHLNNVLTRLAGQLTLAARDREEPRRLDGRLAKMEAASDALTAGVRALQQVTRFEIEGLAEESLLALRGEIAVLLTSPEAARARLRLDPEERWTGQVTAGPGRLRLTIFALTEALAVAAGGESSVELGPLREEKQVVFRWTVGSHAAVVNALASAFGNLARDLVVAPGWTLTESADGAAGVLNLAIPRP